eukprot:2436274-Lingulodinium_polyedra.AAC.1
MNPRMVRERMLQFCPGKLRSLGPSRGNGGPPQKAVFGRFARDIRQMLRPSPTCYDLREVLVPTYVRAH